MKSCAACGLSKPLDAFGVDPNGRSGRKSRCRECLAAQMRERRARDPQRIARAAEVERRLRDCVKVCRKCEAEKGYTEFARCAESPDGLDPRCRECRNADAREFYARNLERERERSRIASRVRWATKPDEMLAYTRDWQAANRERIRVARMARIEADPNHEREKWLRRRARKAGASVRAADLAAIWTGECALCETEIDRELAWPHPMSASVDHIIPLARGGAHEQANLQWAHLTCNLSKGARTNEEAI